MTPSVGQVVDSDVELAPANHPGHMADLRSRVQQSLSGSYTLERELGGGGMSKVFVADEHRLGRKVVVKLLSPELAAAMSADARHGNGA